jgi:hypothetical protein
MKSLRFIACLFSVFVVAGCASPDKIMESWLGHHQSELISSWGPPQQVFDDGSGGRIFVYSTNRSFTSPGSSTTTVNSMAYGYGNTAYGTATAHTTYNPPVTTSYAATRTFFVDRNGRIYRYAWKGL